MNEYHSDKTNPQKPAPKWNLKVVTLTKDLSEGWWLFRDKNCNSAVERFRMGIDELLEENLEFWMKFHTYFTEIPNYVTTAKDLLIYVSKLEENWKSSEGIRFYKLVLCIAEWKTSTALKSKRRPQYWIPSAENDDFRFTSYQATKFQAWKYGVECLIFGEPLLWVHKAEATSLLLCLITRCIVDSYSEHTIAPPFSCYTTRKLHFSLKSG